MSMTPRQGLPPGLSDLLNDGLLMTLVDHANRINHEIEAGGLAAVEAIITKSDVTFGLWQDKREPNGVGVLVVKGAPRLREILRTKPAKQLKIGSIACDHAEQAKELRWVYGDGDLQ